MKTITITMLGAIESHGADTGKVIDAHIKAEGVAGTLEVLESLAKDEYGVDSMAIVRNRISQLKAIIRKQTDNGKKPKLSLAKRLAAGETSFINAICKNGLNREQAQAILDGIAFEGEEGYEDVEG